MRKKPPGRRYTRPSTSEVDVWIAARGNTRAMTSLLSEDERARAAEFRNLRAGESFVTAYAMLRSLLAARMGTRPERVAIERAPCHRCGELHGKPFLADDPSVTFNISHSGNLAVVAIGSERELGIDVEDLSKSRDITRLAARTLSPSERQAFDASGEDASCFLRLWTRKEALLKATGAGITRRLSGVSVPPADEIVEFDGEWTLIDLELPSSYVGTLAVEGTGADVALRSWDGHPASARGLSLP